MARPSKQFKKFAASGKLKETIKSRRSHQQARRKSEDQRTQRAKQRGAPRDEVLDEQDDEEDEDDEKDARSASRGGKAGGVAKTVEELFGGQLDGEDDEGSELDELSEGEEGDEDVEEGDDEEEEEGLLDEAAMKKAMKDLAKKDPEFFKFLEENDKELLDFQEAGPSKGMKKAIQDGEDEDMEGSDEEEEAESSDEASEEADEMDVEDTKTSVTMKMLRQWQEGMLKQHSVRSLRKTLLAFRAAAHMNEDDAHQGNGLATKYSIDSAQVFNKLVITALKFTPVVLASHIPFKSLPNGRLKLSQPKQTKTIASLNRLTLSHFSTLLHLIKSLPTNSAEEAGGLLGMTVAESSKLLPWIMSARKHVRAYLKVLLDLWSSASDSVRIASFLAIRKLFLAGDDAIEDLCLRNTYRALLPPLRHTSAHTLPSINLTKNTAATLFALDPQRSYTHAFGFIRMLAVHLRNVVRSSTSGKAGENGEAFRAVYNWQFVHCIDFWSQVLVGACSEEVGKGVESALRPLIYPLTQIALGVVRLLPSSRYFPLRFHILHSLLRVITKTNTYIPLSPFLLEILDSAEFRRNQPKKSTLKPLDLEYLVRAPAAYPKTRVYQESLADELVFLLGAYHAALSTSIAFPEIVLPVIVALKRHIKRGTAGAPKVQNQIKTLADKLEATGKWVEGKRRNVPFSPRDRGEVKRFLEGVGEEASPTVLKTFLKHYKHKTHNLKEGVHGHQVATDDILFDEAFNIVKAFIKLGTENTIESLQAFTNTHVPSPWWAAVVPVMVPLSTCNKAADTLIDWFGPDDLHKVVGGERWWQVRGLDGIEAEWITENEFLDTNTLKKEGKQKSKELSAQEETIQKMEKLETVMLYIHGGAYFWGSINTHRYQIIRYARKCKGRAFTVNYRKAPQYPWPCPLHDVLAAYFYLISPPPGAAHKPVPASKLVFAGDSAGGALCVTALTVIRDMGLPMPAGAVLISPWVDMTHSFPSVMDNTHSDIIPPHGFVHKPSTTWPVHTLPDKYGRTRVMPTQTNPPPPPGHADKLDPDPERLEERAEVKEEAQREGRDIEEVQAEKEAQVGKMEEVMSQEEMVEKAKMDESPSASPEIGANANLGVSANGVAEKGRSSSSAEDKQAEQDHEEEADNEEIDKWEPKPPKVLMDDPSERPWEIRSQIQQYATNEQLSHPLVSPILQGSLGNLCPLYILAGDGEVLRDEIIYFAHRAAHPDEYPVRKGVIREGRRQRENAKKFTTPTKVHLQAFDGMPHVLTVFIFTPSAKYAYRSIAQFVKHVTTHSADHIARNPFPELHRPPDEDLSDDEVYSRRKHKVAGVTVNAGQRKEKELEEAEREEVNLYKRNQKILAQEVREDDVDPMPGKEVMKGAGEDQNGNGDVKVGEGDEKKKDEAQYDREPQENDVESMHGNGHAIPGSDEDDTTYARPTMDETKDIPHILMIRERVDIHGHVRPMEPKSDIPALQMRPSRIGIIKERPVRRWADGQNAVDKKYRHSAEKVIKKRKKLEAKAERMLADAREQGLLLENDSIHRKEAAEAAKRKGVKRADSDGDSVLSTISRRIDVDRRWGPLDLQNERPPPTAIAARRDTPEALALLKKSIYHTAPKTHMTIPKAKMMQNFRAAFDPNDDPFRAPRQSVSEQQKKTYIVPIHGLTLWNSVLQLFVRKSAKKALKGKMHASKIVDKVVGGEDEPVSKRSGSDAKLQTEEKRSGPSQY